ncbi:MULTISPECIES: STAS/SEC14 domain-containing protein [Streptomyces]|uniref:STAS/SEC14 domain-containing protein n=1 Tax=Streptomyces TaxID=1883 RepID=UPI000A3B9759|nr:STAS/SEC14 domain-containing protein [Streptomyces sp. NRRL B-24572]
MISKLDGMPAGVVGFEANGKISAEDYRDTVLPALTEAAGAGEVRFLLVVTDFDGMTGGAVWQDLKVGVEHLRAWKRVALVTDIEWMSHLTSMFGWMSPGETKVFPLARRDEATDWVAG